jgi:hypothetical protein
LIKLLGLLQRMASSPSLHPVCACAWVLDAQFGVVEHPQLANPDTNQIFLEYVKGDFSGWAPFLAHNMKRLTLVSFSLPTNLSYLSDRGVVPVLGIFHGSHAVSIGTVQALFSNIRGLTATWGDLQLASRSPLSFTIIGKVTMDTEQVSPSPGGG